VQVQLRRRLLGQRQPLAVLLKGQSGWMPPCMQSSVAPKSTASRSAPRSPARRPRRHRASASPWPKPQKAQPTTQMLVKLMLRLTTKVTVSPASSARSSSASGPHLLDHLGPRLGEERVSSSSESSTPHALRDRPLRDPAAKDSSLVLPDPRRGMKLQYLSLMTSRTPAPSTSESHVTADRRRAARSAHSPSAAAPCGPDAGSGTAPPAKCDPHSRKPHPGSVAPASNQLRPPIAEIRRHLHPDVRHSTACTPRSAA